MWEIYDIFVFLRHLESFDKKSLVYCHATCYGVQILFKGYKKKMSKRDILLCELWHKCKQAKMMIVIENEYSGWWFE